MTLLKKTNWDSALKLGARSRRLPASRPRISLNYRTLEEIGDWALFAGVSLVGWITAAIAFGFL